MKTAYYVRWWDTKNDYEVWTNYEDANFDNKKSLEKFVKYELVGKDLSNPVFAYEIGYCDKFYDKISDDYAYENYEPYGFYNAEEIKKKLNFVLAHNGADKLIEIEVEVTQYEIDTRNFNEVIAAAKEAGHVFDESRAVVFQKDELLTKLRQS